MLLKDNNPWLGLESYSVDDSNRFYGRDEDINVVSNTINDNFITTIYGISGAGKTSLINAGITPVLKQNGYLPVRIRLKHKSESSYCMQIIETICAAVEAIGGEVEYDGNIELEAIHENEKLWFFLHTRNFWTHDNYPIKPVLFIDQFEEIFTQNSDCNSRIADFFDSISSIQHDTPPTFTKQMLEEEGRDYFDLNMNKSRMVFIIREDFLARLEDYSYGIAALRRNRIGIKRMNGNQALDVILKPNPDIVNLEGAIRILSKVSGKEVTFSDKVLANLSIDTSILSLFCSELYQRAVESGSDAITVELIEEFGNNIIDQFYSNNMSHDDVDPALAEYLETHLLTSKGFRNSVAYEDITVPKVPMDTVEKGLKLLAKKRILRIEEIEGVVRVEFTHDVLCAVAKRHRTSIKEDREKKSTLIKTVLKTIGQIAIVLITGIIILTSPRSEILTEACFRPDWLLACGLFATLFFGKKTARSRYLNFGLSILLSFLLLRPLFFQLLITTIQVDTYLLRETIFRLALWGLSICLSARVFLCEGGKTKISQYLLMGLNLLMMVKFNNDLFILSLILIPAAATFPLVYSNDKNTKWICILAAAVIVCLAVVSRSYGYTALAIFPLFGLFNRGRDVSDSFKSSLGKCLRFEAWRKDRTWAITVLFIAIIGICLRCDTIGDAKADSQILYYTPITTFVLYSLISILFRLIFNYKKEDFEANLKFIFRKGAVISGISLLVVLFQYATYGFIFMLATWAVITAHFIWTHREAIESKNYIKGIVLPLTLILFCTYAIPVRLIGYNVSDHVKYAKVIGKNIYSDNFILIRDNKGNYGIRDMYNIIVPVEYSDISPYVRMYGIPGMTIQKNRRYKIVRKYYHGHEYISFDIHGRRHDCEGAFPDIVFTLKTHDGESVEWNCNQHMSERNLCTTAILESAWEDIFYSKEYREDNIKMYLSSLKDLGEDASQKATQIVFKRFEHILQSDTIASLDDLRKKKNDLLNTHHCSNTIRLYHKTLSYIEDKSLVNFILDTLYQQSDFENHAIWDHYNRKAEFYIYTNQFSKAERCASTAMLYDSTLTYAYKNLIIAKVLLEKYDEAYDLLEKHGDGMHYMGSMMNIYEGNAEVDIIHNKSDEVSFLLRFNNLYNGINNELESIEGWNVDIDTRSDSYRKFKEFVKSRCIKPYDSAEDRGGYYICRKYEYYHSPFDEWHMGNVYSAPDYKLKYHFYMKDNVEISPAFDTYAYSCEPNMPEDILLIIDYDDKKRKFIDMRGEVPKMIPGAYDHAWQFSSGMAAVANNGKLGFINSDGQYVIDTIFTYSNAKEYSTDRYNRQTSHILNYTFNNGRCLMMGENGKGLIDETGKWIIQPEYSNIFPIKMTDLWILEKTCHINGSKQKMYGIANNDGKVVLDIEYDEIICHRNGEGNYSEAGDDREHIGYFGKDGEYISIWKDYRQPDGIYVENGYYSIEYGYIPEMEESLWRIKHPDGGISLFENMRVRHPSN